eukprot:6280863-Lingulodinium_polyedra.AAC.1
MVRGQGPGPMPIALVPRPRFGLRVAGPRVGLRGGRAEKYIVANMAKFDAPEAAFGELCRTARGPDALETAN